MATNRLRTVTFPHKPADYLSGIVEFMNHHEIPYCFIGGIAMVAYGARRTPEDADVIVDLTPQNRDALEGIACHLALVPPSDGLEPWCDSRARSARREPNDPLVARYREIPGSQLIELDLMLECPPPLVTRDVLHRAWEAQAWWSPMVPLLIRVASPEDMLELKVIAAESPKRPPHKREKDLSDIEVLRGVVDEASSASKGGAGTAKSSGPPH